MRFTKSPILRHSSGHDRDEARLPPDLEPDRERPLDERLPLDRR
jgi:hypothetical protein